MNTISLLFQIARGGGREMIPSEAVAKQRVGPPMVREALYSPEAPNQDEYSLQLQDKQVPDLIMKMLYQQSSNLSALARVLLGALFAVLGAWMGLVGVVLTYLLNR